MGVKRRHVLESGSIAVLSLLGGCAASFTAAETPTEPAQSSLVARLLGPDSDHKLFTSSDVVSVGPVREYNGQFSVPVTLTGEAGTRITDIFESAGVAETPAVFDVAVFEDDRVITRFGIAPGLASEISDGEWDGELRLQFTQRTTADAVQQRLVCGAASNGCDMP